MAAARGLPIPPADQVPPELEYKITTPPSEDHQPEKTLNSLTVPITSRSHSLTSDTSNGPRSSPARSQSPTTSNPPSSHLFRGRAKTLASLTTSSKSAAASEMSPRELQLPRDPFVNGQPIEVYLYKSPGECPICFLYYPPYLNKTRCCDQPICSECFVQIKRAEPHPPEHEQPNAEAPSQSERERSEADGLLVSEPAACPFCVQPEFGVSYDQPPFRRGLTYAAAHASHPLALASSPDSSASSSLGPGDQTGGTRRRATSLSADSPNVITTDKIRPDWAQKLATARANAARRSAAATALHTAAYLVNSGNPNETRNLTGIGRRGVLRRATGQDSPIVRGSSPHLQALAQLAERHNADHGNNTQDGGSEHLAPPRASSRRNRVDELENMMMMEAIRQSLAAEEDRRKREEKEAKKEAKRREKEAKKAEKHGRKNIIPNNNGSNVALGPSDSGAAGRSGITSPAPQEDVSGKGKGVDRMAASPSTLESPGEPFESSAADSIQDGSSSQQPNNPCPAESAKKLHIRHPSSASSSNTSLESALSEQIGSGTPTHASNSGLDPAFNFRSLAAMIGDEECMREEPSAHVENTIQGNPSHVSDVGSQNHGEGHDEGPDGATHEPSAVDAKDMQTSSTEVLSEPTLRTAI